jgi:beta-lactamase superfamily II metal-dependent hydrolase
MAYINEKGLNVDYILLTHEHFDHCWGVNELIEKTEAKVVCMQNCKDKVLQPSNYFNKFYFNSEEEYSVNRVDIVVEDLEYALDWNGTNIRFIETKGYAENDESVVAKNLLAYFSFLTGTKKRESQAHFANLFSSSQYPTAMTFIIMHCPELFKEITSFVKSI